MNIKTVSHSNLGKMDKNKAVHRCSVFDRAAIGVGGKTFSF